eukprot:891008-Pelagomonas_calceolata.AAC.1
MSRCSRASSDPCPSLHLFSDTKADLRAHMCMCSVYKIRQIKCVQDQADQVRYMISAMEGTCAASSLLPKGAIQNDSQVLLRRKAVDDGLQPPPLFWGWQILPWRNPNIVLERLSDIKEVQQESCVPDRHEWGNTGMYVQMKFCELTSLQDEQLGQLELPFFGLQLLAAEAGARWADKLLGVGVHWQELQGPAHRIFRSIQLAQACT